jgi:hypothetical protein
MSCCTDPMPIDQMPSPERIAAVLKKYKMEVLEAPGTVCEDAIAKDPLYDMDG